MSMGGFFSTPPFLRRQERLEIDPPSPNLLTVRMPFHHFDKHFKDFYNMKCPTQVPSPIGGGSPTSSIGGGGGGSLFYSRDHGLRTPPAPPTVPQTTIETIPSMDEFQVRIAVTT